MHGAARLALDRLGHEGGETVVAQRRLADQALEEEDLVGQPHRIAMGEVDLDLAGAAFLQDAVDLEALRLGEVIDVVDDLAVFVDRRQRIGLLGGRAAARAAHRRDDRLVRVDVAGDQEEFHLGRDDGAPALGGDKDRPRVSARCAARPGPGCPAGPSRRGSPATSHRRSRARRSRSTNPGQDHVGFGEGAERVVGPFAGDRLQEDRVRQEEFFLLGEFRGGHRLAAGHAGDVTDDAFHFVHPAAGRCSRALPAAAGRSIWTYVTRFLGGGPRD
jgi:hypothetical protein